MYSSLWLGEDEAAKFAETVRLHFQVLDKVRNAIEYFNDVYFNTIIFYQAKMSPIQNGSSEEGELLCDTLFSLAYGALLLLSHTTLRLIRGRRYGILGPNGSGKTTLMRQLRDGKVENFPPSDQLRAVMVEHSLQGEDASLSVLDFIAAGSFSIAQCLT